MSAFSMQFLARCSLALVPFIAWLNASTMRASLVSSVRSDGSDEMACLTRSQSSEPIFE